MARYLLPRSHPSCSQDESFAYGARAAALHARIRSCRRARASEGIFRRALATELCAPRLRRDLRPLLSQESRDRPRIDDYPAPDRLSACLRHSARAASLAGAAIHDGGVAVLDFVLDP